MTSTPDIPIVDLLALTGSDGPARREACSDLKRAFGTFGLVFLRNHGLGDPTRLYRPFAQFCALSADQKNVYNRPDLWFQRGYTPPNTERAVASSGQPDFKECWFSTPTDFAPELEAEFPETCARNLWPSDVPAFEAEAMAYGAALQAIGVQVLEGVAQAFELPRETFTELVEGAPHVLRVLRYLPLTRAQIDGRVLWGEEHTDFNLLTLLPGGRFVEPGGAFGAAPDAASGLFLRTRPTEKNPGGVRIRGRAPEDCIVAQVGQMLEILTGGTLLATPHEVTAPSTEGWSRYSAAHFVHVHPRRTLTPHSAFRTPASIRAYSPPVLAGTYALKTLVDIGLAPVSALGTLGYRHYGRLSAIRESEHGRGS